MAKKKPLGIKRENELLDALNLQPILESRIRQVRWLYNNSNKCTMVYDEKLVRVMIHRLQERIKELESAIETTITGMEWNAENEPLTFGKADYEHLGNLRELINR